MTIEILETNVNPKQRTRHWDGEMVTYDFPILTVKAKVDGHTQTLKVPLYTRGDANIQQGIQAAIKHWEGEGPT